MPQGSQKDKKQTHTKNKTHTHQKKKKKHTRWKVRSQKDEGGRQDSDLQ